MLTLNDLLVLGGVDPAVVKLVRHQDRRLRPGRLYEAWRDARPLFEDYQSAQAHEKVFRVGDVLASFILTEARKTVFVGLYAVEGVGPCAPGSIDALVGVDLNGHVRYDLQPLDSLADYRDRLVIDWGAGTRSWVQRAHKQPKPVVEIAEQYEPRFPGFRSFTRLIDEVATLPAGWQQVLRSVKGVYLLVDVETGQQYVGSAKGAESLLGRWLEYAADGHGGNLGLKAAGKQGRRTYQVSVLEVVDENTPDETIEQTESYWKTKLLTRQFGLNLG